MYPIDEIYVRVCEFGTISKDELLRDFEVSDIHYEDCVRALVARHSHLTSGPRGSGGIKTKPGVDIRDREDEVPFSNSKLSLNHPWEIKTSSLLSQLLTTKKLTELLGDFSPIINKLLKKRRLGGSAMLAEELANAVVILFGCDLLRDIDRRKIIAKAKGVEPPAKWLPGKGAAVSFVRALGFPKELAGLEYEGRLDEIEEIGGIHLPGLEPYQEELCGKALQVLDRAEKALIHLPTGAGKTRVAVEALLRCKDNTQERSRVILWLAHTEELCEQAAECFQDVWNARQGPRCRMMRAWGTYGSTLKATETLESLENLPGGTVIISTPLFVSNLLALENRNTHLSKIVEDTRILVIDEAHRAAATTYQSVIASLTNHKKVAVIGLTATPFRKEYDVNDPEHGTRELVKTFGNIYAPDETLTRPFQKALENLGVLSKPTIEEFKTGMSIRLSQVDLDEIDLDAKLNKRADVQKRREKVLPRIMQVIEEQQDARILYFGPSVRDASCMTMMLRYRGIRAACISCETPLMTRRHLIRQFKNGEIQVLCNCQVLTTGFDAPKISHIVMARPTVSQVLYEQMIGRGLRGPKFGGTEHCVIIQVVDDYIQLRPKLGYDNYLLTWKKEI